MTSVGLRVLGRVVAIAAAIAASLSAAVFAQPQRDAAAMSAAVDTYARRNGVPGAIAIITDGADVAVHAFGHDSAGQPLTSATRMPVASLSKSFTALAMLQLAERGVVGLDEPVIRYLPEFQLADRRYQTITVRQLLAHRSGMSDATFREKSVSPVPATLEEAVRALRPATLAAAPGERRQYHNPNYWVAARLVEVVSRVPFAAYLRDNVFLPLGMTRSSAVNALDDSPDVAAGHIRVLGQPFVRREPAWFLGGCCGVVTTGEDMARWLSFQAQEGRGGPPIVSADSLRTMHAGLGWNTLDPGGEGPVVMHNGMLFTFSARQTLLPAAGRGIGIAVMTSTGVGLAPLDADAIAEMLQFSVADGVLRQPARTGLIVDSVLAGLIVTTLLGGLWFRRRLRRHQPVRAVAWRRWLTQAGLALPIVWLMVYPWSLRTLARRDLNWEQSLDVSLLLVLFVASLATTAAMLLVARRQTWPARQPGS